MAKELNGTAIQAFWAGTSFLLTSTVFQPTFASFSHIFGRKPVLISALLIFTAGTAICTAATNFTILLVGRSIQGIGGGGLSALTYVVVTDMVDLRSRGKWFSLISLQWAIGSVSGPVIGGALAQNNMWRGIFILNFPFCVIGFVGIIAFLKLNYKVGGIWEKLKKVDWIGSFLFVASITSFLIPLTWGGIMYEWNSWRTVVPLSIGALGLVTFMLYSRFIPTDPLIRGSIFGSSTAIIGYFGTFTHGVILWACLYYLPLYYQLAKDLSPVSSGMALFPFTFTVAPAAIVVGLVIAKTGKYRPSIFIGWILTTLGLGLLMLLKSSTTTVEWIFISLVGGLGLGMLYSAQSFAVQASASNADLPFAAAMYSFFRSFGQTFGVAIGGAIFQNRLHSKLAANPLSAPYADEWSKDASALVQIVKFMADSEQKTQIIDAYVDSLRMVWLIMCCLAGVAMVASFVGVKDISLDRELETEQGFRHSTKVADVEVGVQEVREIGPENAA